MFLSASALFLPRGRHGWEDRGGGRGRGAVRLHHGELADRAGGDAVLQVQVGEPGDVRDGGGDLPLTQVRLLHHGHLQVVMKVK